MKTLEAFWNWVNCDKPLVTVVLTAINSNPALSLRARESLHDAIKHVNSRIDPSYLMDRVARVIRSLNNHAPELERLSKHYCWISDQLKDTDWVKYQPPAPRTPETATVFDPAKPMVTYTYTLTAATMTFYPGTWITT